MTSVSSAEPFDELALAALDKRVHEYNHSREHQSLGDVPPIGRFALSATSKHDVIDGEVEVSETKNPS